MPVNINILTLDNGFVFFDSTKKSYTETKEEKDKGVFKKLYKAHNCCFLLTEFVHYQTFDRKVLLC